MKRRIESADLMPAAEYAARRAELRRALVQHKKERRVPVGPFATFYFESFETMRAQVQEMLYIEKGGDVQLGEELAAYNPLVPQGQELVATLMFEIDDPARRARELAALGNIEHTIFLKVAGQEISAEAEGERTNEAGKTSAVHFVRFSFTQAAMAAFRVENADILLGFHHPAYPHMAKITEPVRRALSGDFA
ncbi:MAG TPA: DUF3501 family protein [Dongiaceae bacterium]|jgi:hypothetical protein|nr:DUF3501 family protein [Dongiaceae bacterium]